MFSTEGRERAAVQVFRTIIRETALRSALPDLPWCLAPTAAITKQSPAGLADNCKDLINRGISFFVLLPEQAVQETVDTDLYMRRRQRPTASRRFREGYR